MLSFLLLFLLLFGAAASPLQADPAKEAEGGECLRKYLAASPEQARKLRDLSMEMEIEASVPTLQKSGKLWALRQISRLGVVTYRRIIFQGDKLIQNDVIAKFLQAEKEASEKTPNIGITPENYKFKHYGAYGGGDWTLQLFELTPKQKRHGLFRGWLWLESNSCLAVREQGEFVKSPSIFLKKIAFVRDYEIRDGISVPTRLHSDVETRVVGLAQLNVRYTNLKKSSSMLTNSLRPAARQEGIAR